MLLAGDVGGTKTNLAIFAPGRSPRAPLVKAQFRSSDYPGLEAVIRAFLAQVDVRVKRASLGVAGPVARGRTVATNLPWVIDRDLLRDALGLDKLILMNDLVAIANGIPILGPDDLRTLNEGRSVEGGTIAVIAAGTGLGESFLTWDGTRYRPHASEGSHADFAPTDPLQAGLLRYLQERFEHVSYERVCSGLGIPNIYAYLKEKRYGPEPPWLAELLAAADDPTPVIVDAALDTAQPCALCALTLETFVSILGAEAGNLALKLLATGGVYLGGGIPPRILPALEKGGFLSAFRHKGRLSELVAHIPVHVILNPETALFGAARRGLEE